MLIQERTVRTRMGQSRIGQEGQEWVMKMKDIIILEKDRKCNDRTDKDRMNQDSAGRKGQDYTGYNRKERDRIQDYPGYKRKEKKRAGKVSKRLEKEGNERWIRNFRIDKERNKRIDKERNKRIDKERNKRNGQENE